MEPKELAEKTAKILDGKKGVKTVILDIAPLTSVAEYFVICSGNSVTHVKSLADNVTETLSEKYATEPLREEGYKSCSWILLDYGSVVVHIFKDEMRDFYALERLWGDAEKIDFCSED